MKCRENETTAAARRCKSIVHVHVGWELDIQRQLVSSVYSRTRINWDKTSNIKIDNWRRRPPWLKEDNTIFIARQHTDARYWYSKSVCSSVCPSVRYIPVGLLDENGLTYRHSFFSAYGSPITLVLSVSNIFPKFRRGHPCGGAKYKWGIKISRFSTNKSLYLAYFLSASLYVSKRGAYWDRLCRDVVGRWLVGRWLSRACTVAKRCILSSSIGACRWRCCSC